MAAVGRTELTETEQKLMAEMMQLVRELDKKNVQGVYAMVADIVQAVSERKAQGLEAIVVLARGLDVLKEHAARIRAQRLASIQGAVRDAADVLVGVMGCLAVAVIGLLAGIASYSWGYYVAAAFVSFSILLLLPVVLRLWYWP
jgi:hypothetical protein